MKILSFFTALFLALYLPNVQAHALHVFAQYDGQILSGKSYYSDLTPAAETYLEVFRSGMEEPILNAKTDTKGEFRLAVPNMTDSVLKVVVEGEEGHRASVVADRTSPVNNQTADLMLLRADIAQLKDKIYWHDILGGIGYIVGIAGLIAWLNARKMKQGFK
ncbi:MULTISPECIES: carboxypeptidase regulatory-like domain-containing protein [unclassified Pasteurella]|uniref:carboxypeptidase regulatory-like domain-containing protein n=1 Tax=unclassified Pasteurella TaxID=2621516 RepID=UPI0010738A37|nr:carboxypeptidase regulatory-like domain-containing protein [Pasteurella sp. 19428wF3_WM03]TFU51359.1 carboxypeptidase regulatory-like domain-containing protein [Pasteurella sp. WM03]